MKTEVIVALGSNLGRPQENILEACARLGDLLGVGMKTSSFWKSEPQEMSADAGLFLNAAVMGQTSLDVRSMLGALQSIEIEMGRVRDHVYHDSRVIDLDIIVYGNLNIQEADLEIPHPRAHLRRFVLLPVIELCPKLVLPGQLKTVEVLLDDAPAIEIYRI